jgi:hypothetical protein
MDQNVCNSKSHGTSVVRARGGSGTETENRGFYRNCGGRKPTNKNRKLVFALLQYGSFNLHDFFRSLNQWRTEGVWRPGQQGLSAPPRPNNVRNPYLHKNTRQYVCNTKFTCKVNKPTILAFSCVLIPILAPPRRPEGVRQITYETYTLWPFLVF